MEGELVTKQNDNVSERFSRNWLTEVDFFQFFRPTFMQSIWQHRELA